MLLLLDLEVRSRSNNTLVLGFEVFFFIFNFSILISDRNNLVVLRGRNDVSENGAIKLEIEVCQQEDRIQLVFLLFEAIATEINSETV